jgi:hypothetical protein
VLNGLLDRMEGALAQGLHSLPGGGGAVPWAGGLSGGSSVGGSGGASSGFAAALVLLAMLLLGGKYRWSLPEFLRPNSALRLAIERPG